MEKYVGLHLRDYRDELQDTIERFKINGYAWKNNPYATIILSTNSIAVDAPNLRLFSLGDVTIPYLKELRKQNVFKKYLLVRNDISIDLVEYIGELEEKGLVDLNNHMASIGYNIETNEPVKNILMEDLHWGFFGASGSGKGISMRALIYQLAQFPESEFYIIDKDNDFAIIAGGKKVRFQQDYKDVTAYAQRFYNFMTYIRLYQIIRAQKYIANGCIDWRQYNDKRRKELKENGYTDLELIPYATFVLDEFQTFRNESTKLMAPEEFDRLINMILSVCRANGIRVVIGTQDTQKTIIGNSLSNVQTRCFFKLDTTANTMGVPENIFPNFRGPQMAKAFVFYLGGRGFVKVPFTEPSKLDSLVREKLDELPDGYVEWKAETIMDLLLSVAKMTDSRILSSSYEMFAKIGFGEEKVKRLEKNDDFLVLVATVWAMFRYYQLGLLSNKSLDFMVPIQESAFGKGDSAKVDAIIYDYIKLLKSDKYSLITKGINNSILGKVCSDNMAQEEEGMDPDDDFKNFVAILSSIMGQYYDQQIHETDMSEIFTGTKESPTYFTRVPLEPENEVSKKELEIEEIHEEEVEKEIPDDMTSPHEYEDDTDFVERVSSHEEEYKEEESISFSNSEYEEAKTFVLGFEKNTVSPLIMNKRFGFSMGKSAGVLSRMEEEGIVGEADHDSLYREILNRNAEDMPINEDIFESNGDEDVVDDSQSDVTPYNEEKKVENTIPEPEKKKAEPEKVDSTKLISDKLGNIF